MSIILPFVKSENHFTVNMVWDGVTSAPIVNFSAGDIFDFAEASAGSFCHIHI